MQLRDRTPGVWQDIQPPNRSIGFSSLKSRGSKESKLLAAIHPSMGFPMIAMVGYIIGGADTIIT